MVNLLEVVKNNTGALTGNECFVIMERNLLLMHCDIDEHTFNTYCLIRIEHTV